MAIGLFIFAVAALIAIDQYIKIWAINDLMPIHSMEVIPGLLDFTYVENYGAAFGIFQGNKLFLVGFTSIVLIGLVVLLAKGYFKGKIVTTAITLIIAGGIGNLIDRVRLGYVVDYLDISPLFSYPVFNFADCCVVIGTIIFGFYIVFLEEKMDTKVGKTDEQ